MNAKLTLKLDKEVIERAKEYAQERGLSLSGMVESYFAALAAAEAPESPLRLTGLVGELAGVLKGAQVEDWKGGYADYLARKYS
jgi:uncharacterized protein DUF6364